jgi:hypothetical protein
MTLTSRLGVGVIATLALTGSACDQRAKPMRFRALVRVESDPGVAQPGATVLRDGVKIGTTDESGRTQVTLDGTAGELIDVQVRCPDELKPPPPLQIRLRDTVDGKVPEHAVACPPRVRNVVVAVRAGSGVDLPLIYLGRPIARTDAFGIAHALVKAIPGEALDLTLDTSNSPRLRPQNPSAQYIVKEQDEVFILDQKFAEEKPPRVVVRKPSVPKRIATPR